MGCLSFFLAAVFLFVSFIIYQIYLKSPPPLPDLNLNELWGPPNDDTSIRQFNVEFDTLIRVDLKEFINNHRKWTPPLEGTAFEYGFNTNELDSWLQYWAEEYDFDEREEVFNQFPQYKTNIQGLDIHFLRIKQQEQPGIEVVPLLLLHGWPGSIREFFEAIPLLSAISKDRNFALELIVPSLPGYGFSDAAIRPGMGSLEVAVIMRNLMHRIGHKKFYVQGGDWGALIGSNMATVFPNEVLGFHTNLAASMAKIPTVISLLASFYPSLIVSSDVANRMYPLKDYYSFLLEETGYMHIQASKPDTIGVALSDSPAGLLAYILEKFSTWTNRDNKKLKNGGLDLRFTKDQLIDNLMVYWSTNSITTSMRLYAETFNKRFQDLKLDEIPTPVPTWALQAKHEIGYQPPCLLKFKFPNLVKATVIDDGGHFLAFELPEVFANDVLKAIGEFRKLKRKDKTEL